MESSGLSNCATRVKEEPSDEENHKNELDDQANMFDEHEDAKPSMNSLVASKIDDDFQYHLRIIKGSADYTTRNIVKAEPVKEVQEDIVRDAAEENRRITNARTATVHNTTDTCKTRGETFTQAGTLGMRIDSVHNKVTYECHVCGKNFSWKGNRKVHFDETHNGVAPECDTCGEKFKSRYYLKRHMDAVHRGIAHNCDTCSKTFTTRSYLQMHIVTIHGSISRSCDICGKKIKKYVLPQVPYVDAGHR